MPKTNNKTLDVLFHDTLKDIYFAEKKILATLPKMAKAAQSDELKSAFEKHRDQTEGHVERLEKVFKAIDKKPQGKTCDAIVGSYSLHHIRTSREKLAFYRRCYRALRPGGVLINGDCAPASTSGGFALMTWWSRCRRAARPTRCSG